VLKVRTGGSKIRAKNVHANQVFSHAQRCVYFMGSGKLAFITPATTRIIMPRIVLVILALFLAADNFRAPNVPSSPESTNQPHALESFRSRPAVFKFE
jgi:hypothetical protein